jgi:rubrerythrin
MDSKPTYLGLLNAVAVGELGGEELFKAWAAVTPSDDVRGVLETVALREAEHARSFAKRIDELGYSVRPKDDPGLAGRVATAKSKRLSDRQKFEKLGFTYNREGPDIFSRFFDDTTIDIQTGELLGRYLSEERDTGRRLKACYASLLAAEAGTTAKPRKASNASKPSRASTSSRSVKRTPSKASAAKSR